MTIHRDVLIHIPVSMKNYKDLKKHKDIEEMWEVGVSTISVIKNTSTNDNKSKQIPENLKTGRDS